VDLTEAELARWDAWTPSELARRLTGVTARWYVIAGWALDLFLGRVTREHEDLEIGIAADDFGAIHDALAEFELFVVGQGRALPPTEHALATHRQTWVREPATGAWRLDVIREPWDGDTWAYERDPRITRTAAELLARTADDIPYMQPEVVLLFKANATRPKDEDDFAAVLPQLDESRRSWLVEALEIAKPGHVWIDALRAGH
jgi:Aminoglycoside-2''-adenylyltransferase